MVRHRSHGEGSVYRRTSKAGKVTWYAEFMLGRDADGKVKRWRSSGYKTKREASEALGDALRDHRKGILPTGPRQSVRQFLTAWLETVAKPSVFIRTYHGYEELIRLHALPALGDLYVHKLTPQHLQALYADRLTVVSARRVLHLHRVLHNALNTAVDWGLCAFNAADRVRPPKVQAGTHRSFSEAEAVAFLRALEGELYESLFVVAICTGMRQGELLALQWIDVDLSKRMIHLTRARSRVRGVGLVAKAPKSESGREVPLIALAVDALRRQQVRLKEWRLKAGPAWVDGDLVFPNTLGKPLNESNVLNRSLYPLLERAGLPRIRFHDLRHSAATLMLRLGATPKDVQVILGHSQIGITMDTYAASFPGARAEAVGKLQELLGGD